MIDIQFIIGLALAIPLSIIGNLLTPKITEWWSNTSEKRRLARYEQVLGEYERVKDYKDNRGKFHEYLMIKLIGITFIGFAINFVLAMVGGVSIIFYQMSRVYEIILYITAIATILASMIGYLLIISTFRQVFNAFSRVKNFNKYEKSIHSMKIKNKQTGQQNSHSQRRNRT